MRLFLRQLILFLMRNAGIIRIFQFILRNRIAILTIHGVMDERDNPSWKPLRPQLSRDKLEEYLSVLSKRYHFISLMDAVEMLSGHRPVQPYSLVLTFDDGYRNNLTHALPILRRYNAPATFFVPTDFINNPRPFWFDRLDYALQQTHVNGRKVKVGSFTMYLESGDRETLQESFKEFRRSAKKQKQISDYEFLGDMERLSESLEAESGRSLADIQKNDDFSAIMSWENIRENCDGDVTIGSHTIDHIRLDKVDSETARYQLAESKRDIEAHTGISCRILCYPNGSFNEETVNLAKECGYVCGLTAKEGLNKSGDDLMKLKRIGLPIHTNTTGLLALISGVSITVSNMKSRILRCGRLLKKICKVPIHFYRLTQSHGIKRAIASIGNDIYSNMDYIILRHNLNTLPKFDSDHLDYSIDQLTRDDIQGIEDVCNAWPANWRSKHLKTKVVSDLERGDLCFLLRSNGNVIGAAWLGCCDEIVANCPGHHFLDEGLFRSMFIVPEERGKGLSKLLLGHLVKIGKERGISQIFGYARPSRIASIRSQLSIGFDIVGTLKVRRRVGKTGYRFIPMTHKDYVQAGHSEQTR